MKTLILFISLFLILKLNAQIFAPDEATWFYTYNPEFTLDAGYQKIEIIGDSIINNQTCKILQKTNIGFNYWDREYYEIADGKVCIYEEDSIVYYNKGNQFYKLYDFTAKKGDVFKSISYQENCNTEFSVEIDSISNIIFDDKALKKFHCTIKDSIQEYQTYYIEKIGYPTYLFPSIQIGCDLVTGPHYPEPLRCYKDNDIGEYSTGVVASCDYTTGLNENQLSDEIICISPNPVKSQESIKIEFLDKKVKIISVYNILGEKIIDYSINNETDKIITLSKPNVYIICFTDNANRILTREKIVVQ